MFTALFDLLAGSRPDRREKVEPNPVLLRKDWRFSVWRDAADLARPPRALRYPFPLDAVPTIPITGFTIPGTEQ